jgi:phosphoribosylformylglycinamidine synthase
LDGAAATVGARYIVPSSGVSERREFSSSEYSKAIAGIIAGEPPAIDLTAEKCLQDCLVALAAEGSVQSAHDISDGGLAVTLAESCFASAAGQPDSRHSGRSEESLFSSLGATIKLDDSAPAEHALFNERGARAVVSVTSSKLAAVLNTARQYNVAARELGKVTRDGPFRIEHKGRAVINGPIETLRDAWAYSLERVLAQR